MLRWLQLGVSVLRSGTNLICTVASWAIGLNLIRVQALGWVAGASQRRLFQLSLRGGWLVPAFRAYSYITYTCTGLPGYRNVRKVGVESAVPL